MTSAEVFAVFYAGSKPSDRTSGGEDFRVCGA
jgi:hypothetical protein